MKRKLFAGVVATAAVIIVSGAASAQMMFMGAPPGPPPFAMMLAGIDLSPEQQTAIDGIMKSHQPAIGPLMDQLHSEHQQMTAMLLSSGSVSLSDLAPLEQQRAQTGQQLQQEMLKAALEIRAVLTPDQLVQAAGKQKKLEQIHQDMRVLMVAPGAP